ncbi:MAG: superoxide dismutase [Bacteroidota bacterium]
MAFELPPLPYAFDALAPHIDAKTMEVHHGKHHQGYVNNLNKAIVGTALDNEPLEAILKNVSQHGDAVRNNGGGHYNHALFWTILSPKGGGEPSGEIAAAIHQCFGSFEQFKEAFTKAATTRFGSGWAWLYVEGPGRLSICSTPNQDNPLMDVVPSAHQGMPILGLDVWEHAYYLRYQNRRPAYIEAFWNVVNWQEVAARYQAAL